MSSSPPPFPSSSSPSSPSASSAPRLILASGSPRRQELLREAGYAFEVIPSNVDESRVPGGMSPSDLARVLALAKAEDVASQHPDAVVLGADTVVAFGEMVLGKPADAQAARQMLELLSGTTHVVITGVAAVHKAGGYSRAMRVMSAVHMRALTADEVEQYVASGQWEGKAGGYGIQDQDPFVMRMAGSHTNIVGLPMRLTRYLLAEAGVHPTPGSAGAAPSSPAPSPSGPSSPPSGPEDDPPASADGSVRDTQAP